MSAEKVVDRHNPSPEANELLRQVASPMKAKALEANHQVAKAIELPLRKGILSGDIRDGIFEPITLDRNTTAEFPLDLLAPGMEKLMVAYTIPNHGYIPQRNVEADYIQVPIYNIGGSIDANIRFAEDARWDVVSRMEEVLRAQFTKKLNNDAWQVLLSAAVDRNIIVLDSDAAQGQFTKRLVSLMKTVVRRNGGGNSTSADHGMLTDLYMSPEAMEDIRNWGVDQIDEVTRREIFTSQDGAMNRIFGVNLHDISELGDGQEYQNYLENTLGITMPTAGGHQDVECVVGLDLRRRDSFVMPIRQQLQLFEDDMLHRQQRFGWYGWMRCGFGALDSRRVILGSL
jgi:hypothetical protein